jgi:hypothetical protein
MNNKERTYLKGVYKDCIELEKQGFLTEYGTGEKELCIILLKLTNS